MTTSQIDRRLATAVLERVHPQVYRFVGVPPSWRQELFAAQAWAGDEAVISHRSAACLLGLDGIDEGSPEITLPSPRRARAGIILHRSTQLERSDWRWRSPFRVTTPERTICDISTTVNEKSLEEALDSALRLRLTTIDRIWNRLSCLSGNGRRGYRLLRDLLTMRAAHRVPNDSSLETAWERVARKGHFPPYVRQMPIEDAGSYLGRIDFAWPTAKVAVETDSWKWHSQRRVWERDQRKNNFLQEQGWVVLRFTWRQIIETPDEVIREVWAVLAPRLPKI